MRLGFCLLLLFILLFCKLIAQCPEIATTSVTPSCIPNCELCVNDIFTVNLTGFDLPNGGKVEYYLSPTSGFNPYSGAGTLIGSANITTPGGNCRICPELMGFMIDACGVEQNNEFIIMWTGSGFNTSNFTFDFAAGNNTGGGQNADIGGGCSIQAGGAGSVGGCTAIQVGTGFSLPANAVWIIFTSSAINYSYDFSSVCALGLKVYVSKSTCARSIGAFTNGGGTGTRTQGFSINGCSCGTNITYDLQDPNMMGDGDAWAGGVTNGGCSASISGAGTYIPAKSIITPFTYKIPATWCDKTYEIVGIVNPKPDPMCCKEIFTERFSVTVKCPAANKASLENCDDGTGKGKFLLEDAESTILGSNGGTVEWFKDAAGTIQISSPYISISTTIYARIKDGNCYSPLVPIDLKVTPFTAAKSTYDEKCAESDGFATFALLNLENIIRSGNNGVNVKFYEDINKSTLIFPPIRTESITIYAATCKGACESVAVPIKLIVNPLPIAKNYKKIECPETDGKANFDLNSYIPYIKDSIKNNTVTFFKDSTLRDTAFSPVRTDSTILYALVSNGECNNKSLVSLKVGALIYTQKIRSKECKDANGNASFNLNDLEKQIQNGDPNIIVKFYKDSSLLNLISSPFVINQSTVIFAQYQQATCFSNVFSIQLDLVDKPTASSISITRCAKADGTYDFDTDSLSNLVNSDTGITVDFYQDILLNHKIKGIFTSSNDTIYAISKLADCNSDPVEIYLHLIPSPRLTRHADTLVCNEFLLDSIKGVNLGMNTSYFSSKNAGLPELFVGNPINQNRYIYRYSEHLTCVDQDSFYVKIQNSANAGKDQKIIVCEGNQIDLSKILVNADPGGKFVDLLSSGNLNGNIYNTTGQNGKTIKINYIKSSNFPCMPDSSEIIIQILKTVNAGLDTLINLCSIDSVDLINLLRNADPGGIFTDQAGNPISSKILGKNFGFGQYEFYYTVGDGITCPKDNCILTIRFKQTTVVDPIKDIYACNFYVLPIITGQNTINNSSYYTLSNRRGVNYFAGDTIFNNIKLYAIGKNLNFCTNEQRFSIFIGKENIIQLNEVDRCPDYFIIRGGIRFDSSNPIGSVTLPSSNTMDCDTTLNVNLSFLPESVFNLDSTLCEGSFLKINNHIYDANNPTGKEILKLSSSRMCDSMININLSYRKPIIQNIDSTLCNGSFLTINGTRYNQSHPAGMEILRASSDFECDTSLTINLKFLPLPVIQLNPTLCTGDSIQINGKKYNSNKISGIDTLKTSLGCDSILKINISFYPPSKFTYTNNLCYDDSLVIGNKVFNRNNPNLQTVLKNASFTGCDSLIDIKINFFPKSESSYSSTLCQGNFILINNKRYDENNPSGTEIIKNGGFHGCDSTVQIQCQFIKSVVSNIAQTICAGDSIKIGRSYYSQNKLQGSDTLIGASRFACDSIVNIQLSLLNSVEFNLIQTLCPDEIVRINGKIYDSNTKTGREILKGKATNGCDSIVNINLSFSDDKLEVQTDYSLNLGSEIQINAVPDFVPVSIQWTPSDYLSCTDCLNPSIKALEDITYTITLVDENGCITTKQIKVTIIKDVNVYVPNVFSPNGDNINDKFEIFSNIPELTILNYYIYDRWGELIYSVSNTPLSQFKAWDGNYKSQILNPGVYVYYIRLSGKGGFEKTLQGDVSIIR